MEASAVKFWSGSVAYACMVFEVVFGPAVYHYVNSSPYALHKFCYRNQAQIRAKLVWEAMLNAFHLAVVGGTI